MPAAFIRHGRPTKRHLRLIRSQPIGSALPRTRGECQDGARPCPLVTCRHHLALDVSFAGGVKVHWLPEDDPNRPTCSLDAAELGGLTHEETAALMGCTRERVRQIEELAIRKIREPMTQEDD